MKKSYFGAMVLATLLLSTGCFPSSSMVLERKSVDLSNGSSISDVGSVVSDTMAFLETGCDCIEVSLTLPDGAKVNGMFESILAEDGPEGTISTVRLRKEATSNPLVWQESIKEFSLFWGGESTNALTEAYNMRASAAENSEYTGATSFESAPRENLLATLNVINVNEENPREAVIAVEWLLQVN